MAGDNKEIEETRAAIARHERMKKVRNEVAVLLTNSGLVDDGFEYYFHITDTTSGRWSRSQNMCLEHTKEMLSIIAADYGAQFVQVKIQDDE